jgi:hypothetical protein
MQLPVLLRLPDTCHGSYVLCQELLMEPGGQGHEGSPPGRPGHSHTVGCAVMLSIISHPGWEFAETPAGGPPSVLLADWRLRRLGLPRAQVALALPMPPLLPIRPPTGLGMTCFAW